VNRVGTASMFDPMLTLLCRGAALTAIVCKIDPAPASGGELRPGTGGSWAEDMFAHSRTHDE
jgi:hypothetical protein